MIKSMHSNRPFLPEELFQRQEAEAALADILKAERLSDQSIQFLGIGRNAVFATKQKVIKITPAKHTAIETLQAQIDLANFLYQNQFPIANSLIDNPLQGSVQGNDYLATVWRRIPKESQCQLVNLGEMISLFHELTKNYSGKLAQFDYLEKMNYRFQAIEKADLLSDSDLEVLAQFLDQKRLQWKKEKSSLRNGIIHGDVHLENIISTKKGSYLVDLDWISQGALENDLFKVFDRRFTGSKKTENLFFEGYGIDPNEYPRIGILQNLRLFSDFSRLLQNYGKSEANEIQKRMIYWRNNLDEEAPLWSPQQARQ